MLRPQLDPSTPRLLVGDSQIRRGVILRPRFIDTGLILLRQCSGDGDDRMFGGVGLDHAQLPLATTGPLPSGDYEAPHVREAIEKGRATARPMRR